MTITKIKGYDEYGYEAFDVGIESAHAAQALAEAVSRTGLSAQAAAEAIYRVSELLARVSWCENEITVTKDALNDTAYQITALDANMNNRIDVIDFEISDLRSAMDAKTENPNQKSDLEIFSQIEWSEHFLKFGGSNIFLN